MFPTRLRILVSMHYDEDTDQYVIKDVPIIGKSEDALLIRNALIDAEKICDNMRGTRVF